MRQLRPLELMIAALLLSAAHLAAQCEPVFSFSVYDDGSVSADGSTAYGYTSTEDTSTLCSCVHSDYQAYAVLYAPDGSEIGEEIESGFESSVSAPTNGVSGTYEAQGAGTAFCSCLQGYFGGGGPGVPVTVQCPETITISSIFNQFQFNPNVQDNFPSLLSGFGIIATMQVGPGSLDGSTVTENVTAGVNGCSGYNLSSPSGTAALPVCVGNAMFSVGPGGYNSGGAEFGINYPGSGSNQFLDAHLYAASWDLLWRYAPGTTCTVTCSQTYSACGVPIGGFTITEQFTHSSFMGNSVTDIAVTKQ
jgi:hypothetical protein